MTEEQKARFQRLQARLGDPLLTVLTILFALLLFVIAPLHAAGIFPSQDVGLAVGVLVIATVIFAYGFSTAVIGLLLALGLAVAASVLRHRHQTPLDLYLDACAWILLGIALSYIVARAVFAPGQITYHRIMGAILLYLTIGMTFVALYTFLRLARSRRILRHLIEGHADAGQHHGLFQLRNPHHGGGRSCSAAAPARAKPHQHRGYDRSALSRHAVSTHRHARDRGREKTLRDCGDPDNPDLKIAWKYLWTAKDTWLARNKLSAASVRSITSPWTRTRSTLT